MTHTNDRTERSTAGGGKQEARRPPTSADVARLARVSRATVSFVLNAVGDNRVGEETRQRVLAAAEELGYVPHALASSLRAGHSNLVLIPAFDWPGSLSFFQTMSRLLDELGYTVVLQTSRSKPLLDAVRTWAALRPMGVFTAVDSLSPETVEILHKAGIRAIMAIGTISSPLVPTVLVNFAPFAELAAHYLQARGHRHIAVVMPRDPRLARFSVQRLAGVNKVGREYDLHIEQVPLAYGGEDAARLVASWRKGPRPTAVFTYNDEYGGQLLGALQDAGVRVPDDIALVGCDNLPLCEMLRPRLSSVFSPPNTQMQDIVAFFNDLMLGRAVGPAPGALPPPQLIIRESS